MSQKKPTQTNSFGFGFGTGQPQSAGFGFGTGQTQPQQTQQAGFGFGTGQTQPQQTGFGFGTGQPQPQQTQQAGFGFGTGQTQPQQTGFGFGTGQTQPQQAGFGFGTGQTQPQQTQQTGFGFGTGQPQQTQQAGFGFGTGQTQPQQTQQAGFGFGLSQAQPQQTGAALNFGLPGGAAPQGQGANAAVPQTEEALKNQLIKLTGDIMKASNSFETIRATLERIEQSVDQGIAPSRSFNIMHRTWSAKVASQASTVNGLQQELNHMGADLDAMRNLHKLAYTPSARTFVAHIALPSRFFLNMCRRSEERIRKCKDKHGLMEKIVLEEFGETTIEDLESTFHLLASAVASAGDKIPKTHSDLKMKQKKVTQ